jgi:hypothetical protein
MQPLPLGELGATPWSISPFWFVAMALAVPALVWLGLAWRRALLECPNRVRRSGVKEMRRLLKSLHRYAAPPRPAHLHAWLRATARVWDVRTSAPCTSEISQAVHALTGDATAGSLWRELWQSTEHGLYAADARPAPDWLQRASSVAATVPMPKRERLFPNRLGHWLPSITGAVLVTVAIFTPQTFADVPWSAPPVDSYSSTPAAATPAAEEQPAEATDEAQLAQTVLLSADVQQAAQAALETHWNDWAAHHNLAAFQIQEGELNAALAHAIAAFVQHPGRATRETLQAALGDTQATDPNLRRLLSGSWYERAPALLSPAGWQRLAMISGLIVAAALSTMVLMPYLPRTQGHLPQRQIAWVSRGGLAAGGLLLIVSLANWSAYGTLSRPDAAVLVQAANASPVPTDLVPVEETSPLVAGTVVRAQRTFLGWREVSGTPEISGWTRSSVLMPLYASR